MTERERAAESSKGSNVVSRCSVTHIFQFVLWGLCGFEELAAAHEHNITVRHSAGYWPSKDLEYEAIGYITNGY